MSVLSTSGNYGARVVDNQQGVKQFYVGSPSTANWIYRRLTNDALVITPVDSKRPIFIDNDLIVKKNLYVDGSIYNPSDAILKENVNDISSSQISKLFDLNPISFSYKNDKEKLKHFGLLAQDVEKVFPELVKDQNVYKSVNYQELLPIMLAKMKQMQTEIDELKETLQK